MRNLLRFVAGAIFALGITTASAAVNVNPSHHANIQVQSGAMVPPDFTGCDFSMPTTFTHTWYVDPVNGQTEAAYTTAGVSMDPTVSPHQGDAQHPWNSLQAVFQVGKSTTTGYTYGLWRAANTTQTTLSPIQGGDEVLLMNGEYGPLNVGAYNLLMNATGPKLTVAAAPGQTSAIVDYIHMGGVSNIVFTGFTVQSLGANVMVHVADNIVVTPQINPNNSHNIIFDNLTIQAAPLATAMTWTQAQWTSYTTMGFEMSITRCVSIQNNHEWVVNTGYADVGGYQIKYINNDLGYFASDGIDYHDDDLLIQHNKIHDFVNLGNGDHIDGMQGVIGAALFPVSHRVWIDGNYVAYQLDPNLPFVTGGVPPAINGGIDQTNGIWVNLYVTNNTVVWNNGLGVGINGCSYCNIDNNTIVNPGSGVEVYSSEHVHARNNLTQSLTCTDVPPGNHVAANAAGTIDMQNNILIQGGSGFLTLCSKGIQFYTSGGRNPTGTYWGNTFMTAGPITNEITAWNPATFTYDFHLLSTSHARGYGVPVEPLTSVDINGVPYPAIPDVGAMQFQ